MNISRRFCDAVVQEHYCGTVLIPVVRTWPRRTAEARAGCSSGLYSTNTDQYGIERIEYVEIALADLVG